jgi:hypothetical protein
MILWNLLDGGSSRIGPLLGPSESMRGGIPGTNPRQGLASISCTVTREIRCAHRTTAAVA